MYGQVLDEDGLFSEGLVAVRENGAYGYVDVTRKVVIPCMYQKANPFHEGLATVRYNEKWGVINKDGATIIPHKYDYIGRFSEGLVCVAKDGKMGFIDKEDNLVVPYLYDALIYPEYAYSEGLSPVRKDGKWGFINKEGITIIPHKYDNAFYFSEGLALVKKDGKWGFVDKEDNLVVPCLYDDAEIFSEDLACVKKNGKWGFIDKTGSVIIPFKYDFVFSFKEGLAVVEQKGKRGYINTKGELVIPLQFEAAWPHNDGMAEVRTKEKKYGFVDNKGNISIYPQYDGASSFSEGLARVFSFSGRDKYIDREGNEVIPLGLYIRKKIKKLPTIQEYIKPKVEDEINKWQKKDEFESGEQWAERVNETTRKDKITELTNKYKEEYAVKLKDYCNSYNALVKEYFSEKIEQKRKDLSKCELSISSYDADNQSFLISGLSNADIILHVDRADAKSFKQNWEQIKKSVAFDFVPDGNDVALSAVKFTNGASSYVFDGHSNVQYAYSENEYDFTPLDIAMNDEIDYNFDPVEIISKNIVTIEAQDKPKIENKKTSIRDTDIDTNIPEIQSTKTNTFAVIIGNENYQKVSRVEFAVNDANTFAAYCQKTLGLPQKNVRVYKDATFATMLSAIDDIKNIAKAYKGDISVIFYYAGHGVPNESSNDAYLLPIDTDGRNTEVCYPLNRLYSELGALDAKSVTVFMDACFSGSERGKGMLTTARGVAIKAKAAAPHGNMIVFSAASSDETAYPYKEKGHGLFTYFLLKKLQETKGDVSLGELGSYIIDNVTKESVVSNGKSQTPTVVPSASVETGWQSIKLR